MNLLTVLLLTYVIIMFVLFVYGNNCLLLAYLYRKRRKEKPLDRPFWYPMVTVQLPVYNEQYVVERLIRKVAEIDYPWERLEVQVLDDSTDETTSIIQNCINELRGQGLNIYSLRRPKRDGYKAGALRDGLKLAHGDFIAVFDADFLPDPNFLKRCIPYFSDPKVGMVQTRWGHINEDYSPLTRALSIGIDGHFQIEQSARYSAGLFLNFNGTAGIWRRQCIEDSGGWQDDTLTEDLDLSYRAQLRGWRLVFLPEVVSPAEVPAQINAFKRQQFRWAKGSIQCAKKLLPGVITANIPVFKKMEALLHLTYYSVHPLMVALLLLSLPLIFFASPVFFYFKVFALGTFGPIAMYALSQRELYGSWKGRLMYLPMLTILGTGISVNNTRAVVEALLNRRGMFQRTPKFGIERSTDRWNEKKYRLGFPFITVIEAALGVYALVTLYFALISGNYFLAPFLALYSIGYFYVSGLTVFHSFQLPRPKPWALCILGIIVIAAALRLFRAWMGDLSEDPYHHWLVSAYLAETGKYADPLGKLEIWPPGYHLAASGILFFLGRDIFWLKLANILFSLGSIYLAYLIACRHSKEAGILAASFLALNPFELLTSSTSYTEPMAVFFFLLTIYLLYQRREKGAGIALLLASATRYEVLLAVPFLLFRRERKLYLIAPSLAFLIAWSVYTLVHNGFFPESILNGSRSVLAYEIGSGAVMKEITGRTLNLAGYFLISSPLVYAAGLLYAGGKIRGRAILGCLTTFTFFYLAMVFLATASGIVVGSFRYFSFVIPLLCIFGGVKVSRSKKLVAIVVISLILALPFYFNLYSKLDTLSEPEMRAGGFLAASGAKRVISNSPLPLYYSGLSPSNLFGAAILKNMNQEQGIRFLRELGIEYIAYVDSPPGELERVFPGIGKENPSGLELVYDANAWEQEYGAKKVYIYNFNGLFKRTGSYVSSSPLIADIDGDGYGEIIAASDKLYVWKRNGSQLLGFPAETRGLIASTPSIAYTKSGAVIFVGSDDNRLYAWWYNGSGLMGYPKTADGDVFSKPLPIDMNGDGEVEVVIGSDDGKVYAWYMNGSSVAGWPVQTQGYVSSSPVAADLDGDGKPEIIVGSWDKKLYAWRSNGSLLPGFPIETGDAIWATPRIADLDGDGSPDIVAASDMVYAWNKGGEQLPGFPIKTNSYIVASPLVRDIDLDGRPEIVVAADSLYVFNSSGALKSGWPIYTGYYFWASPTAYDLDGDSMLEIILGDWSGNVYAFKPDGRMVTGFPKHTHGKIFASAAVGDIDKDGNAEIVVGSWDRGIYFWSVGSGTGSFRKEYKEAPVLGEGPPALNDLHFSEESGVIFLAANLSGKPENPKLNYYGNDDRWHPSPMMLSEGRYVGMIEPLRQKVKKYYITLESQNRSYRFPQEGYYELEH